MSLLVATAQHTYVRIIVKFNDKIEL